MMQTGIAASHLAVAVTRTVVVAMQGKIFVMRVVMQKSSEAMADERLVGEAAHLRMGAMQLSRRVLRLMVGEARGLG